MSLLITSVTPADNRGSVIGSAMTNIPEPSDYAWGKQDISAPSAGRVASMVMLKMLMGKTRTLSLTWNYPTYASASQILQAFDHEYLIIKYQDALTGAQKTGHFYCGDMSADCHTHTDGGRWESITFNCIQATPDGV